MLKGIMGAIPFIIGFILLAIGLIGCSDSTGPAVDVDPPGVVQVLYTDSTTVNVVFNESVDPATATKTDNYTIIETVGLPASGNAPLPEPLQGDSIEVSAAVLQSGGRTVVLTTEPMDPFAVYDIFMTGIKDVSGNEIDLIKTPIEIRSLRIFTIAGTGAAGQGAENVDPLTSQLYWPKDLTFGPDGLPYILDWNNHRVRVIENNRIRTILGSGLLGDAQPGYALDVGLNHPTNIAFDSKGNLILAAWHNSKVLSMDRASGWVEPICGTGARSFNGDGIPATEAFLNLPSSVAIDAQGRLFLSDQANQRIRMVDTNNIITTVAGNGTAAFCGDGGPAVDACLNNSVDQFAQPGGCMTMDGFGNIYIADTLNDRVRKVDTSGIITTVAGNGAQGFSGDGGAAVAASLNYPTDVAVSPSGNLYIADKDNHCVRMVDGSGIITTVAGSPVAGTPKDGAGFEGDGGRATLAKLNEPWGIAFDSEGNLYIADYQNNRIRVVYK